MEVEVESCPGVKDEGLEEVSEKRKKTFKCDECKCTFAHRSTALRHRLLVHNEGRRFTCSLCSYVCYFRSALMSHSRVHSEEKPFKCNVCEYTCKTMAYLKAHERSHSLDRKTYECSQCRSTFSSTRNLRRHKMSVHQKEKRFACTLCDYASFYKSCLKSHLLAHSEIKLFKCDLCDQAFHEQIPLKKHQQRIHNGTKTQKRIKIEAKFSPMKQSIDQHQQSGERLFGVPSNQESYLNEQSRDESENKVKCSCESNLNELSLNHTEFSENSFLCDKCGREFGDRTGKNSKHKIEIEDKRNQYKCSSCNFVCYNKVKMERHSLLHSVDKPYTCSICGLPFKTLGYLKSHELRHGLKKKTYKCNQCDSTFPSMRNVKRHEMSVHKKEKNFTCNLCSFVTFYKSCLKSHMLIHSKIKPFKCKDCDLTFYNLTRLKKHKVIHGGLKPYKCGECGAAFYQSNNLKIHKLAHKKGKNYLCEVCGATFNTAKSLRRHEKLIHIKQFDCSSCDFVTFDKNSLEKHLTLHKRKKYIKHIDHEAPVVQQNYLKELKLDSKTTCMEHDASFKETSSLMGQSEVHHGLKGLKMTHKCGTTFNTDKSLRRHEQSVHMERFDCSSCEFVTFDKNSLEKHLTLHKREKTYKCNFCEYACNKISYLKQHQQIHIDKNVYKCNNCRTTFSTANDMVQHHKLDCRQKLMKHIDHKTPLDQQNYLKEFKLDSRTTCNERDASFEETSSKMEHSEVNYGLKGPKMAHKCVDCNFYSDSLRELRRHFQGHSEYVGSQVVWKCTDCKTQFKSYAGLFLHKMDHSEQAPFKCLLCDSTFKQEVLLKHHVYNDH